MSLTKLHRMADGPFAGCVSRNDVTTRIAANDLGNDPAIMRKAFARLLRGDDADLPPPAGSVVKLGGIDGLWLPPSLGDASQVEVGDLPVLVWFHGGGYCFRVAGNALASRRRDRDHGCLRSLSAALSPGTGTSLAGAAA